jgi:hypothetical protein
MKWIPCGVGLSCLLLCTLPAWAAPVEAAGERNTSEKPEILSAVYVPRGTAVIILPEEFLGPEHETNLMMCAAVELELLAPGAKKSHTKKVMSVMLIRDEHLEKFPTPLEAVSGDADFKYYLIDSTSDAKRQSALQGIHKLAQEMLAGQESVEAGGE